MSGESRASALVQGTLHMLVLKTLALEPLHGHGIGVRLEQISRGVFRVNAGSLFPALRRLERDGLIKGAWRVTDRWTWRANGPSLFEVCATCSDCCMPTRPGGASGPGARPPT